MTNSITDCLSGKTWDCIVIGAGPAGAIAARQIAKNNMQVLLVDREIFPRAKVCGCCINASAQEALSVAGLDSLLDDNGARQLDTICLFNKMKSADLTLPRNFSLSREKFDMALISAAIAAGVQFLSGASAKVTVLDPLPQIRIKTHDDVYVLQAKLVIVADGLSGQSLDLFPQFNSIIKKDSRFGASVILNDRPDYIQEGKIYMVCGEGGYVGMVVLEDGRLNIAAALSHEFSRQYNGPGAAAAHLLLENALPLPKQLTETHWKGTNLLSRSRCQFAAERLFVIGDATGYAEPFTGEGMSWALWSGLTVSSLAIAGIKDWSENLIYEWHRAQNELTLRRRCCQLIALALRHNIFRTLLVNLSAALPMVINPVVQIISGAGNKRAQCIRG